MKVAVNISKADRKNLARELGERLGLEVRYAGVPTCSYIIGDAELDKDAALEFPDGNLTFVRALKELGYDLLSGVPIGYEAEDGAINEPGEKPLAEPEKGQPEATGEQAGWDKLTVELPRSSFTETALDNLEKLIESKASLIRKSIGTDSLDFEVDEEKVSFPWFTITSDAEAKAYTDFVTKLCETAREAKSVTAKDKATESEKFTFRSFLLKLGFIGREYKEDRKILMRNLTGWAAFPNETSARVYAERQKAKKEAQS